MAPVVHTGEMTLSGIDWMRAGATVAVPAVFGAVLWGARGALIGGGLGALLIGVGLYLAGQVQSAPTAPTTTAGWGR